MEIDALDANSSIRQGDIFARLTAGVSIPQEIGTIITADCDIENGSKNMNLVYLRVITVRQYIEVYWAKKKIEKNLQVKSKELSERLNSLSSAPGQEAVPAITEKFILDFIEDKTQNEIDASIISLAKASLDSKKLEKLLADFKLLKEIQSALISPSDFNFFQFLSKLANASSEKLFAQARGELSKPPDEVFFLSHISTELAGIGYYVLLNEISAIGRSGVTDSASKARENSTMVCRLSRLKPVFKHRLAQQFSFLFQRIGLPDEYIGRNRAVLESLSNPLTGA